MPCSSTPNPITYSQLSTGAPSSRTLEFNWKSTLLKATKEKLF